MSTDPTTQISLDPGDQTSRYFTLEQANRALVLVRRIVVQLQEQYARMLELSRRTEGTEQEYQQTLDPIVGRFNGLMEELREIGCELKDPRQGLVDFAAQREGRKIWLCWKPGEDRVSHWHEWDEGFSGRRPIESGVS
jgi:hypothetical protein